MKRGIRLPLAPHRLGHMVGGLGRPRAPSEIATHAETGRVVVRRAFGRLRAAGFLTVKRGDAGGWRLAGTTKAIAQADVHPVSGDEIATRGRGDRVGRPDHPKR